MTRKEVQSAEDRALIDRLRQKGSTGLDMSPGDQDCWDAHRRLKALTTGHGTGLSFTTLRKASVTRALRWHPKGLQEWSPSDWGIAAAGELGEALNVIKKLNRLRDGMVGNKPGEDAASLRNKLGEELADTVMYIDLLAAAMDIDLEIEVISKFNSVSVRNNFPDRLMYERLSHGHDE